ncbi:MAG: hypothetical protein WC480_00715 [Patescibacteria group bacterium]
MEYLRRFVKTAKKYLKIAQNKHLEIGVLAIVIFEFAFPQVSLAHSLRQTGAIDADTPVLELSLFTPALAAEPEEFVNSLPEAAPKPKRVIWVTVTAYSSTVDQCDDDPCRTANGFNVCLHDQEDVVAANFLPFGTEIKMPDYFGDQVFTVQDRMNARYDYRVDVWMKSREAAKAFGVRRLRVEIY